MNACRSGLVHAAPLSLCLLASVSSHAASLTKVNQSEWQGGVALPSYVNMYVYVPDNRATKPPILVASHHCQGTGTTTYNETKSTFVSQADKNGYIIIFPEATGHNCWDVGSAKSLKHDGGGDTHAVAQMVRYSVATYGADASRVYAFGGSSGGMMTQALLGIYPDIFTAGVAVSGVPCGCWAEGYTGDVATNGQWSGACAGGKVTKTAQAWGDLVRAMYPGYNGHRARVQLWHGDPDSIISFVNFGEAIKEWTNVLGLSQTATNTENPNASTTRQSWNNTCGFKVLETFAIKGAGHSVQWDLATASAFLGLDKVGGQDPEIAACSGTGGASGVGGAGSGGAATGGTKANGGHSAGGAVSGGATATGGSSATTSNGGAPGTGGANAAGVRFVEGGTTAKGGAVATGSAVATGGAIATGGAMSSGGNAVQGGSVNERSGGAPAAGGAAQSEGGAAAGTDSNGDSSDGCSCAIAGRDPSAAGSKLAGLFFGALALRLRRRRRLAVGCAR